MPSRYTQGRNSNSCSKKIYSLTRLCTDLFAGRGRVSDAAHDGALGTGALHFTFHISEKRYKKQKWDAKVNARGSKHCRICPGSPLSLQVQEGGQSVVKKLFGIETEVSVKCHEAPTEPLTCAVPSSLPPHHTTPHPCPFHSPSCRPKCGRTYG